MPDVNIIRPLIQKSLNLMETVSCWERKAAKRAHIVGLQGEKRRLRWLSREARNIVDKIEHKTFDVLKIDICASPGTADVSTLLCTNSTMKGMITKLWSIYDQVHTIANEMVNANYRPYAEWLYSYAGELFCILAELQRNDASYERGSYDWHHVSRYQETHYNIHDEYESKEEAQGYSDSDG